MLHRVEFLYIFHHLIISMSQPILSSKEDILSLYKEDQILLSFKCYPIRYRNGKILPDYVKNRRHCKAQNDKDKCQAIKREIMENDTKTEISKCIWINEDQIGLYQAPWIKYITELRLEEVEWMKITNQAPSNWDPIERAIPNIISVKSFHLYLP